MTTYSRKRSLPQDFDASPTIRFTPLNHCSDNVPKPRHASSSGTTKSKKPRLTQMTIDLGGNPHRKCKLCGMEYISSNPEDALLHKQYHNASMAGMDISKGALEKANVVYECERRAPKSAARAMSKQVRHGPDKIVQVGRRDALGLRRLARKALQVAEKELGAVEIAEDILWSQVAAPSARMDISTDALAAEECKTASTLAPNGKCDRYKVFCYIQDNKCLGLCLAERIREGRRVLQHSDIGESSSISTDVVAVSAKLGISRIWVSREFRNLGIARTLIDSARLHFLSSIALGKESVAWSQPTESGAKLARAWFGKEDGWLVYAEQGPSLHAIDTKVGGRTADEGESSS